MATFTVYDPSELPNVGQTVYPVRRSHVHTGAETLELRSQPGRKNLSHEPCERGWLGTTNDVSAEALGRFEVVRVRERWLNDGRQRVDVEVK